MTGASVNFKAVKSAGHAVSHASREVAPTYLLPADKSLGTVVLLDDKGKVSQVLAAKMALASPRAKVDQRYSPVWEGILNLRRPEPGEDAKSYRAECSAVVTEWYKRYEASTGHKVLRVDVHLDEGHMVDGEAVLNAHAHVIADRTNGLGRVIKLSPKQLRELQTMTAEVTSLERGKSSFETGRKHISHQAYKYLAERGRLETQQVAGELKKAKGQAEFYGRLIDTQTTRSKDERQQLMDAQKEAAKVPELVAQTIRLQAQLDGEPARLAAALKAQEAQYRLDREALKASGTAKQADYQALKKASDEEIATLKTKLAEALTQAAKAPYLEAKVAQLEADKAKLTAELAATRQEVKAKGTPAHLIAPGTAPAPRPQEPPKRPEAPISPPKAGKTPRGAFLEVYGALDKVELHMIDGARLDASEGRLGVFSWPNKAGGGRVTVLCELPSNKVMPQIGQVFDFRAVPGKGGVGR